MEKRTVARRSKREYLASTQACYQRARRAEKTAILDEFTTVCGYHRKDALRLLHQSASASSRPAAPRRGRATVRKSSRSEHHFPLRNIENSLA